MILFPRQNTVKWNSSDATSLFSLHFPLFRRLMIDSPPPSEIPYRTIGALSFAAIDFESAGAERGQTDHPVQIGIASCERVYAPPLLWGSYIATDSPVLWAASRVHGITTAMLREAPTFSSLWTDISSRLEGHVIIAHNISTERRFLRQFPGHGFGPWIDTLVLSKMCLPELPDYSLSSVSEFLGITDKLRTLLPEKNWHDALFDATASLLIFRTICEALSLLHTPLHDLADAVKY